MKVLSFAAVVAIVITLIQANVSSEVPDGYTAESAQVLTITEAQEAAA